MDIFLDETHSLHLLRASMRNADFVLVNAPDTATAPLGLPHTTLRTLGIPALLDLLCVPDKGPLRLLAPSASARVRARDIRCRVWSKPRGNMPFRELVSKDPNKPSALIPPGVRILILSPENIALGMARMLHNRERAGTMTHQCALLMLLKLCLELCGTFSHDPDDPHGGDVVYKVKPVLTAERLRKFAEASGAETGLALLREVLPLVYDGSGSPQESFMGVALFGSSRLGGLSLAELIANRQLDLTPEEQQAVEYRTITPDFQMPRYRSVVEFNGGIHDTGENPEVDRIRMLDYQTLRYQAFVFVYRDVRSQDDFMRSAARIVRVMEWFDGRAAADAFERKRRSKAFRERQRVLFEVFRPWLRHEGYRSAS